VFPEEVCTVFPVLEKNGRVQEVRKKRAMGMIMRFFGDIGRREN